jgi:hypothetical protein
MTMRALRSAALFLLAGTLVTAIDRPACGGGPTEADGPKLSGPFTSGNLTIYLIHGPDRIHGKVFLTLEEALEQKKAIVHETKNVNQLTIENLSKDVDVFIQAGDIVKGGQQDRVLAFDLLVPPGSGTMPIAAFCVEAGRWTGRSGEASGNFACSNGSLVSNGLKVAARAQASQQEVWNNVKKAQEDLSANLKTDVQCSRSKSSLQLTLENQKLNDTINSAIKELTALPEKGPDAIGCAVAINGKVIGADTFASAALFKKLWPKLLKAAIVEAVAEKKKDLKFEAPDSAAVMAFLTDADKGKSKVRMASPRISEVQKEGNKVLLFESHDTECGGVVLRRNYLTKIAPPPAVGPRQPDGRNPQNSR